MNLSNLNKQQENAVKFFDGPLLVFAGAGSGKTRVIVNKIAYMVSNKDIEPSRILALTFTKKAAGEMKDRVSYMLGQEQKLYSVKGMFVGTFHSWGAWFLRHEASSIGLDRDFVIYDTKDKLKIIKKIRKDYNLGDVSAKGIAHIISNLKNELMSPEEYLKTPKSSYKQELMAEVYQEYEKRKNASSAVDFDDLLLKPLQILYSYDDVEKKYKGKYDYILVDEYQDTNQIQYLLVKHIATDNVCVVGDDDQSIYSWRGARVENILQFKQDFDGAEIVKLDKNYRSTQKIIDAAYAVVNNNSVREEKEISSVQGEGEDIVLFEAEDEKEEAMFVINKMNDLIKEDYNLEDIAIFYRTNAQSQPIEKALVDFNIPYKLVGGVRFYERMEIKDLVAYASFLLPNNDEIGTLRVINVPSRRIGPKKIEYIRELGGKYDCSLKNIILRYSIHQGVELPFIESGVLDFTLTQEEIEHLDYLDDFLKSYNEIADLEDLGQVFQKIVSNTGYKNYLKDKYYESHKERFDNLKQLYQIGKEYSFSREGIAQFVEEVVLMTEVQGETHSGANLMTLHASKGLEFPVVFIVGVQEGKLPHFRSLDSYEELEEERRLFYVGMTRAQKELFVSWAIYNYKRSKSNSPSRFISEIPDNLVERLY
jgi:DNA helicase-2/ATP-dependent DNA helicase PcrA